MLEGMVIVSNLELPTRSCETVFMLIRINIIRITFFLNKKQTLITGMHFICGMKY